MSTNHQLFEMTSTFVITLILLLRTLLKDWYCKFGFTRFTEWYRKPVSSVLYKFMSNGHCRIKEKLLIGHRTWTE